MCASAADACWPAPSPPPSVVSVGVPSGVIPAPFSLLVARDGTNLAEDVDRREPRGTLPAIPPPDAASTRLGSPLQRHHREDRPPKRRVGDHGERGVPGGQRGREADVATPLDDVLVAARVAGSQQDE